MYPRNAASPERIAVGPVILIADGTPQSSGVTITVRGQGGAEATGGNAAVYGATGVIVYYTPTQAETDFTSFTVIASKANCIPACVTIITSASATPGYAGVDWSKVTAPTSTVGLSGTTIKTATDVETDTADIQARLPAALTANGNMKSSVLEFIATALTETSGQIAAAFKQFFDVGTPTGTMKAITAVGTLTTYTGNTPQTGDVATLITTVGAAGAGLTDLGGMSTTMKAQVEAEANDALVANHLDHLLAADYDPAAKPGVATALLNELVESDAGVSRYTVNALENAPSGTGASAASIADAVWDEAQADHVAAGSFGEIATESAAILVDTNELQVDWVNGGRLDLILDIIAADTTTDIPATLALLATATNLATVAGYLDTEIASLISELAKVPKSDGAVSLNATVLAAIADAYLDRNMATGTDSGSTTVRTPRQALRAIRNKWGIVAGTLTVTKEDDATPSWTSALTGTAGADPITTSDPAGP